MSTATPAEGVPRLQTARHTGRARMGRPPVPAATRFWRFVEQTATCWRWSGTIAPNGYGHFRVAGQSVGAPRFSWVLHYGPVPPGHYVSQSCEVRACVRPDHLYLRTRRTRPRLTEAQVLAIRALQGTLSQAQVARLFQVTPANVRAIWCRLTWRHLPDPTDPGALAPLRDDEIAMQKERL